MTGESINDVLETNLKISIDQEVDVEIVFIFPERIHHTLSHLIARKMLSTNKYRLAVIR